MEQAVAIRPTFNAGSGTLAAALIAFTMLVPGAATAQQFPTKPVRALVPYSAGSGPDAVLRDVGDKVSRAWGQQLIVENRPGANGWIAIEAAKKSAPDGYTLLQVDNTHMALQPHLYKQLPFDPVKDFEPVAPLYWTHFFIVVPANSPWKSVADLIAAAKAKPGRVTYGTWGIGSVAHVGNSMLEAATGIQMTHVPFKELPQLYAAVANGEVDWAFGTAATAGPLLRANKVRFLALAAPKRLAQLPDVPTVAEAGGPANFEVKTWVGLFAPRGTPKPVIDRISADVAKALSEPSTRERLATFGFEPFVAPPAEVGAAIAADSKQFAEVVRRAKISLD
jgi:tripartite-type tricarboxylate transporter receptor subunit TctC